MMIRITGSIAINEDEIGESFVRASGPGGQNVNKVSTAVELRFDARHSPSLPDEVRQRLEHLAGSRLTLDGVIVLFAQRYRTQERNRADALERLVALIQRATEVQKPRRPTRPTFASKIRHRTAKTQRADVKSSRGRPQADD